MNADPTRIPQFLRELSYLWEAQPDRRFVDVLAQLEAAGVSPASSDEDVLLAIANLRHIFPHTVDVDAHGRARGAYDIVTSTADIAVDRDHVIVRALSTTPRRPSVWAYSHLVTKTVSGPLTIADEEGNIHKLGVIARMSPRTQTTLAENALPELHRTSIGDTVYVVELSDDTRVSIGRKTTVYRQQRRALNTDTIAWESIPATQVGQPLVVAKPAGHGEEDLGVIQAIWRAHY
ncbi:hypothetical protein [Corynebacterium aquilae]|uniref:Uncharacterized protein n=1 Tax=Corynebacterium aquilae DSM 44791 TaxID=1431546 RepID=A0A1L7CH37_9CORY|nr:hypothetical protein [Corynebacterium aquilae]APT85144.1 hypothetical protein CAQU_08735 [Corynebacterium aquilae DSM 44791]